MNLMDLKKISYSFLVFAAVSSLYLPISILIESAICEWKDMCFECFIQREMLVFLRFNFLYQLFGKVSKKKEEYAIILREG